MHSYHTHFEISYQELQSIMQNHGYNGVDTIAGYGGNRYLINILKSSEEKGISPDEDEIESRRIAFGENALDPPEAKTFCQLICDAMNDTTLYILEAAAVLSLTLYVYKRIIVHRTGNERLDEESVYEWVEGVAILVSICAVLLVTAFNDYSKEKQFRSLQNRLDNEQKLPIIRGGQIIQLPTKEIVVGDVALIKYGDSLPADGVILQSNDLKIDESSLTGESDLVVKGTDIDPMLLSGTHVMEGSGKMLVMAVGPYSQSGIIMGLLGLSKDEDRESLHPKNTDHEKHAVFREDNFFDKKPTTEKVVDHKGDKSVLQRKLIDLSVCIGKIGTLIAVLTVAILCIQFLIDFILAHRPFEINDLNDLIEFLLVGVSVLVVAVPEGLPLAVTLSLAYSVKKMMDDNNLVRHLDACETMGNATTICSDKTGTLTTNRMTAVQIFVGEKYFHHIPTMKQIPKMVGPLLCEGISVNSLYTSKLQYPDRPFDLVKQIGNKTECGLLGLVDDLGGSYEKIREKYPESQFVYVYTFNSNRKSMSTVINKKGENRFRLFTKGASEIVLQKCTFLANYNGDFTTLDSNMKNRCVRKVIQPMAEDGLRTIAVAYRDFVMTETTNDNEMAIGGEPDWRNENEIVAKLTLLAIVGIEDPVRPEVPMAIQLCQKAGITVRMVTGDNITTARSIASKCGIIGPGSKFLVIDGKEFNQRIRNKNGEYSQHLFDRVWPDLRVLARSSPTDKYVLVKGIIDSKINPEREVVAVTGDGTNDGPALKKADVGFAMGIAGTDVAKEACDIIVTDDNFRSIVLAVMWGRNVYDSITKFIQFQLTVNIVAVSTAFLGSCFLRHTPLRAVQLLWVNLIMDTLASLALATEKPTLDILNRKPYGRNASLISDMMVKNIMTQSIYQLTISLWVLFQSHELLDIDRGDVHGDKPSQHFTMVFNTLVMMTLFNEICSRKIHGEKNFFKGIQKNPIFLIIWLSSLTLQCIIVQFGGLVFFTKALNAEQWLLCLAFGTGTILWAFIMAFLPLDKLIGKCRKKKKAPVAPRLERMRNERDDTRWVRSSRRLSKQYSSM